MTMTNANYSPKRFYKSGGTIPREEIDRLGRTANISVTGAARLSTDFGRGMKIMLPGASGESSYPWKIVKASADSVTCVS
jgi:hypothetical protein